MADVRLSDVVFAPHYVAPVTRTLASSAVLHLSAAADSEVMGALPAGATFEVFDLSGGKAWGIATGLGLVGYIDASTLGGKESA